MAKQWVWKNGAWIQVDIVLPTPTVFFQPKIVSPTPGQTLQYDGSFWVNAAPVLSGDVILDGGGFDPFDGGDF